MDDLLCVEVQQGLEQLVAVVVDVLLADSLLGLENLLERVLAALLHD